MAGNRFKQVIEVIMKGAGKAAADSKKVQKGLQGVAKDAAKIGAAFYAAKGGINATQNFVNSAMGVERIKPAFESLRIEMGFSVDTMTKLNKAVDGTVKQTQLMTMANQAMTLGVVDSEEGMAELFDIAQRLGKSLGVDVKSSIDSLVTGMGRQSIMMLDNLGIIVDTNKAYDDYAATLGKTASELTDQEKKIAFNNAALDAAKNKVAALGTENLDTADSFAQMSRASDDFAAGIGKALMPILERGARGVTFLLEGLNDMLGFESAADDQVSKTNEKRDTQKKLLNDIHDTEQKRMGLLNLYNDGLSEMWAILLRSDVSLSAIDNKDLVNAAEYNKLLSLQKPIIAEIEAANRAAEESIPDASRIKRAGELMPTYLTELMDAQEEELNKRIPVIKKHMIELDNFITKGLNVKTEEIKTNEVVTTSIGETATAYQQWADELQSEQDTKQKELDWAERLIGSNYELAESAGLVNEAMTLTPFEEFSETQKANLEQQQLQQDMIDNFIVLYGEEAEALGLVHSQQIEEEKMYEDLEKSRDKDNDSRKETIALMKQQVNMAMALGASQLNAGQAAQDAAGAYITAELQKMMASYLAKSFADTGFWGGMAAVASSAVVGSLAAGAVKSMGKLTFAAEGMNEVVTEPTLIMAGEEGAEYVNIEPTQNEGAGMGGGGQIIFQGNVLSKDFIEDEAIPMIRDAVRRGHTLA